MFKLTQRIEIEKAHQKKIETEESVAFFNERVEEGTQIEEFHGNRFTLKIAILAIFTALGPALSISFIWFPYFELMTLTVFLGGMILGPIYGIIQAVFSTTLLELVATFVLGPGFPIYPFKVVAFILVSLSGALIGKILPEKSTLSWRVFIATLGGMLTLLFDLLVNIGMIIFLDLQFISYFSILLAGLPVTAIRVTANTLLFAFVPEIYGRAIHPLIGKISIKQERREKHTQNEEKKS